MANCSILSLQNLQSGFGWMCAPPTTNSGWRQYWFGTFFIMVFFFCMQWANENWIYELNSNLKRFLTELHKHQRCFDRNRHCALSSSMWCWKLVPAWCKIITSSKIIIFFTLVSDLISCIFLPYISWQFVMDHLQKFLLHVQFYETLQYQSKQYWRLQKHTWMLSHLLQILTFHDISFWGQAGITTLLSSSIPQSTQIF